MTDNRSSDLLKHLSRPCEGHAARHTALHAALDELVACFVSSDVRRLPSRTTVMELMEWSAAMMRAEHQHQSVSSFESHTVDGLIVHKCECGAYGAHAGIEPIRWGIEVRQHL